MVDRDPDTKQSSAKSVDSIFEERAAADDNETFANHKRSLFLRGILLSAVLLILLYVFSPGSRVKTVSVIGNNYLSKKYVESLCGVKINELFYAQFPGAIAAKVQKDPMIASAEAELRPNNLVEISIQEKQPIGYRYDEETPTLLFTDGTICDLTSEYMSVLARIPYITGFNDETATHLLTTGFAEVKPEVIEDIAEIVQYPLSYDEEAIEIRMRDGGIFFGNYFSLKLLNNYDTISRLMTNKDLCLYADNGTTVAAARACPWDEKEIILEYWTDEEGNYIYNKWGDRAVKHYYTDKDGNYYLDDNGNPILIPINEYGQDERDSDFLNHYFEGYYKNGYFEIPEESEEDSETKENSEEETAESGTETPASQEETVPAETTGTVTDG